MLAFVVGLVLAVWGLLRLRAVPRTRAGHPRAYDVEEAPCAPQPIAETHAPPQTISRDAVRRSSSLASRAPGSLCERALVSILRRARTIRPALRASRVRLHAADFKRMTVLRA